MFYKMHTEARKYILRKLAAGIASCAIGCVLLGGTTTVMVHGETDVEEVMVTEAYGISDLIATLPASKAAPKHRFEKVDIPSDEVEKQLAGEATSPEQLIHISKLGETGNLVRDVSISQLTETLKKELGDDFETKYSFVKIDGAYLTKENFLYLAEKSGQIINTEGEYNQLVVAMLQSGSIKSRHVYASFDLDRSNIDILLDSVGLGLAGAHKFTTINDIDMYVGELRLATSAEVINKPEFKPLNRTLAEYIENDKKILDLIRESKALTKETEAERVKTWATFIKNKYEYDSEAFRQEGDSYSVASSIFSATERGKAMCVGFSVLSARAYKMMGIRAYVVHGRMLKGAAHAVTRVYYEDKWHFVDTTSAIGDSSSYLLDTYKEVRDRRTTEYAEAGEMIVHPELEKWMEQQKPRDLLLVNKEITDADDLKNLDKPITEEEKNNLLEQYGLVLERFEAIRDSEKVKNSVPNDITSPLYKVNGFIAEIEENRKKFESYPEILRTAANRHRNMLNGFSGYAGQFEDLYKLTFSKIQRLEELRRQVFTDSNGTDGDTTQQSVPTEQEKPQVNAPVEGETVETVEEEIPVTQKEEWKADLWAGETQKVIGQAGRKKIIRTWKTVNGKKVGSPTIKEVMIKVMKPTMIYKGTKPVKGKTETVTEIEIPVTIKYLEDPQLEVGKTRVEEGKVGRKKVIKTQPTVKGKATGVARVREEVLQAMVPRKIYKGTKKRKSVVTHSKPKTSAKTTSKQPKKNVKTVSKPTSKQPKKNAKTASKPTSKPKSQSELKPVYRLYHSGLKVHLYTADLNEQKVLQQRGWKYEGISWKTETTNGIPVYRLYQPVMKYHFYTRDANEYQVLGQRGWKQEGIAYRSSGSVPIYRLYHKGLKKHLYTRDANERDVLSERSWKYEGVAWYSQP